LSWFCPYRILNSTFAIAGIPVSENREPVFCPYVFHFDRLSLKEYETVIDLLITDVVIPEMAGQHLFAALQAIRPELEILYMSGYTASAISHHGVLGPGVHFIQKPFSRAQFAAKLREVLED
jgi:response regulator RpfG family c-di-GMP phosphodiesterase